MVNKQITPADFMRRESLSHAVRAVRDCIAGKRNMSSVVHGSDPSWELPLNNADRVAIPFIAAWISLTGDDNSMSMLASAISKQMDEGLRRQLHYAFLTLQERAE